MSIFDSIIGMAEDKFSLEKGKAGSLISGLLSLIVSDGSLNVFLDRFRNAGLSEAVDSWVTTGSNSPISNEQLKSALGNERISSLADQAGVKHSTAALAMSAIVPQIVDRLSPDGEIPDNSSLLSKIGGYLTTPGVAAVGATTAAAGAFDRLENSTGNAKNAVRGGVNSGTNDADSENSALKWLFPLLLLALLVALCFWFCGKSQNIALTNSNANVNKAVTNTNAGTTAKSVDSRFSVKADNGRYVVSGIVPDEATKKQIVDALTAQYGAENVNFDGLKVDAAAKPFAAGWWDNFNKLLPDLKDWKNGSLAFTGKAITEAAGFSADAVAQIKALFSGWTLPLSIAGAEGAARQANEESLKELAEANSIDEVIKALNVSIINFASGKSDIPADAAPILKKAAEVLQKQSAGTAVEIGGYTDNQGNAEANKKLSQSRADSIKKALVGLGVSDAMLKAVGYGDASPVGDNTTEEGRFKNRRIEYNKADGSAPTAITKTVDKNAHAAK